MVTPFSASGERGALAPIADGSGRLGLPEGLTERPVIAILRRLPSHGVLAVADVLRAAGIRVLELTAGSPDALRLISKLRSRDITVGVAGGDAAEAAARAAQLVSNLAGARS